MVESAQAQKQTVDPTIGQLIAGKFRITRLIGEGGMGSVYEARQEPLNRPVAVKLLKSEVNDEHTRERFEREAKVLGLIGHKNAIQIFDYGEVMLNGENQLYIVMEFVKGKDLDGRITKGPPISPDEILYIASNIAQGLAAAHHHNIVHRDLKPANILLAEDPSSRFGTTPKILDFGIARLDKQSHLTQTGMVFGTPAYMAPEQATGSSEIGSHTDVYAFGLILYELLAGRRPFLTVAPLQLIFAHANKIPDELGSPQAPLKTEYVGKIPSGVIKLVHWCLAKEPKDRPISAPPSTLNAQDNERCLVTLLERAISADHPSLVGTPAFNTEAIEAVRYSALMASGTPITGESGGVGPHTSPGLDDGPATRNDLPALGAVGAVGAVAGAAIASAPQTPLKAAPPPPDDAPDDAPDSDTPSYVRALSAVSAADRPIGTSISTHNPSTSPGSASALRATPNPVSRNPVRIALGVGVFVVILLMVWMCSGPDDKTGSSPSASNDPPTPQTENPNPPATPTTQGNPSGSADHIQNQAPSQIPPTAPPQDPSPQPKPAPTTNTQPAALTEPTTNQNPPQIPGHKPAALNEPTNTQPSGGGAPPEVLPDPDFSLTHLPAGMTDTDTSGSSTTPSKTKEQLKREEEQRREAAKRAEEQRREAAKRAEEAAKREAEKYKDKGNGKGHGKDKDKGKGHGRDRDDDDD